MEFHQIEQIAVTQLRLFSRTGRIRYEHPTWKYLESKGNPVHTALNKACVLGASSRPEAILALIRPLIFLIIVTLCLLVMGCRRTGPGPATTWLAKARSPDGNWLAMAGNQQWIGPGITSYGTTVYLKWKGPQPSTEVLVFSNPYEKMHLKMEWITSTHLKVIYAPLIPVDQVVVDYQVIKCAGVQISIQEVTSAAFNTSR
jgi:hypothetical protein